MSKNDKQFEALEKAMKVLQIDEKDVLAVEAKWFNHLPIYDEKDFSTNFVTYDYPQWINYLFLKVEPKELCYFENNPFTTNFSQEIQKDDEIDNLSEEGFFDNLLEVDKMCITDFTNKLSPYSMLIDAYKEMTCNLVGNYTIEKINKIRLYFTNKFTKYEKTHNKH